MHSQDRLRKIVESLRSDRVTSVEDLKLALDVSAATIRRDLNQLHDEGRVRRVRGGAIPCAQMTTLPVDAKRGDRRYERPQEITSGFESFTTKANEKRAIARLALDLIAPNQSMIIDGGSTTHFLASILPDQPCHVLTPSIPILQCLMDRSYIRVQTPGGELFREQGIILNPYDDTILSHFSAERLFIGAQAISHNGLMQTDSLLVHSKCQLIKRASQVIVLADSSKFDTRAAMAFCPIKDIDILITDDGIRPETLAWLNAQEVEVRIANVARASVAA